MSYTNVYFFHFIFFTENAESITSQDSEKNEQNTPGQVKQAKTSHGRYTHRQGIVGGNGIRAFYTPLNRL